MLLKFAFRNVLRNRKRTLLTATAVFFAALIVCLAQGWMNGMLDMFLNNYVKYQTGNVRITTEGYVKREKFIPVDEIVNRPDELIRKIKAIKGVDSVEEKIRFGIIMGKEDKTVFAFGMGIDLQNSSLGLKSRVKEGSLEKDGIYIGHKLAKKLNVKLGEKLLIAAETSEGGLNGIKLEVKGIYRFGVTMLDEKSFFISLGDAKKLLKIRDGTTEIYVYTKDIQTGDRVKREIDKILPAGLKALTVKEQMKKLYDLIEVSKYIFIIFEALIIFLASFVVINTMMMAIFERIKEVGTLKAMGMMDKEIFINFIYEGGIIGTFGGITGALLGYILLIMFYYIGIDFEFMLKYLDMPIEYVIRPSAGIDVFILTIVMSIILPAVATMYPANYAKKLQAAEALRKI